MRKTKTILEDISGTEVFGYRATGFSYTKETPWFFEKLSEAGYRFDSSLFPSNRGHGGIVSSQRNPYLIKISTGDIIEFPISLTTIANRDICLFGGGYLRLAPYWLIKNKTSAVNKEGRSIVYYIHPREIDPNHPTLPMPFVRKFKSYVNIKSVKYKMNKLFADFEFITFKEYIDLHGSKIDEKNIGM